MGEQQDKIEILCPWCQKMQMINSMPNNMIMAFNCKFCDEPIVVIQGRPLKIDKAILETGDIIKLQEYILDLLDKEFNISAEINKIEKAQEPIFEVPEKENKVKKKKPISKDDIKTMKKILDDYKIPRNGDMFS